VTNAITIIGMYLLLVKYDQTINHNLVKCEINHLVFQTLDHKFSGCQMFDHKLLKCDQRICHDLVKV
jgi:hypothetical protein